MASCLRMILYCMRVLLKQSYTSTISVYVRVSLHWPIHSEAMRVQAHRDERRAINDVIFLLATRVSENYL